MKSSDSINKREMIVNIGSLNYHLIRYLLVNNLHLKAKTGKLEAHEYFL